MALALPQCAREPVPCCAAGLGVAWLLCPLSDTGWVVTEAVVTRAEVTRAEVTRAVVT